ncbi:MAG: heptose-I-phosphate ethanolaminephosphotransferase [Bacteroidia bacterium]|jgi:heptose-I-phosphate ethanolaminephosphotransferase
MSYVCQIVDPLSNEENKIPKFLQPYWVKPLSFLWFLASVVLILTTLKPYNKAYKLANAPNYIINHQSESLGGYTVDYSGVVDFVSYANGQAQAELQLLNTSKYRLSFTNKYDDINGVSIFVNGVETDSFSVIDKKIVKAFELRKNDYLKIRVKSIKASKPDVGVKIELDNAKNQKRIYAFVILWVLVGLWLIWYVGGIHVVLPASLLVVACYNEHLYLVGTWTSPMIGFVAVAAFLTLFRFLLAKTGLRILTRIMLLLYDYVLVLSGLVLGGFIWNYKRYGYRTDYDTIIAVLQSNTSETLEFAFGELGFIPLLALGLILSLPVLIFIFHRNRSNKQMAWNHGFAILLSAVVGLSLWHESQFIQQFNSAYSQYYEEIAKFNEVQKGFKDHNDITASKSEKGETYIFVIGESQSKEHMSLYGYHRPTTPFLDSMDRAGQISVFTNAYSSHTHTIMVLRDALTQSNQYNNLHYTQVPSLINVLNASQFETVWLSNQVKLSNWDNIVSAIAGACNKQVYVNKNIGESMRNSPYDERLLPELKQILSISTKKNRAIFIHVLGNHGQYSERYPKSFKGIPSKGKADFGNVNDLANWESYDNSILYSDYILGQIHKLVGKAPGDVKLLTYFSDHAEDLSDGRGHNSGQFTYRMTQIPLYVWASDAYKTRYSDTWSRVEKAESQMFSNDLFFQMSLDLAHIQTPLTQYRYNVLSPRYSIDTFKTKSGAIDYQNTENNYTNLDYNAAAIFAWEATDRIGVHRTNSLGKLNEVHNHKIRTIEVDVKLLDGELFVGHGEDDVMSGLRLTEYLAEVNLIDIEKIWLDVKNLDKENLKTIIENLIEIDERFRLKSKLIVETQSQDYNIARIAQLGFNTSYYVPTSIADLTPLAQKEVAKEIAKQIKYQKVRSISFDSKLYDFVKKELESQINPTITYHTWNFDLNIRDGYFILGVQQAPFYQDKRIETILVRFPSVFDL